MRIGTRVGVGFVAALAIIAGATALSWVDASELIDTSRAVEATNDVIRTVDGTLVDLIDIETGDRGFVVTGREDFLEPYQRGRRQLDADLRQLSQLVRDDSRQASRVATLERVARQRLAHASEIIELRRGQGIDAATIRISTGVGKALMDEARGIVDAIRNVELRRLADRTAFARARAHAVHRLAIASALTMVVLTIIATWLLTRSITRPLAMLVTTAERLGHGERVAPGGIERNDEIGDLARALGDMAERRAHAESRMLALIEDAGEAFFLADLEGRYVDVNAAACSMLGYSRDELLSKTIMDLIPPGDVSRLADSKARLMTPGAVELSEWALRRRDGSQVPVEVTAKILADGRWQAFARDVTERKRYQAERESLLVTERGHTTQLEAIRKSSLAIAALETAPNTTAVSPVLQAIVDEARQLTGADFAALGVGVDPARPFETWVWSGLAAEEAHRIGRTPRPIGLLGSVAAADRAVRIEHVGHRPEGPELPDGHPVMDAFLGVPIRRQDRAIGYLYLARRPGCAPFSPDDAAAIELLSMHAAIAIENARLYEQVQLAVRARQDVLAVVSHDLRNPLNAITLRAQLLARGRGADKVPEHAEAIRRAVTSMNQLIRGLLDEASLEAGTIRLAFERTNLGEIAATIVETFAPIASQHRVRLECQIAEPAEIACDRERVLQILWNLVGNALKFTQAGGTVTIRSERHGDNVQIAVADTGVGIASDALPHIFDRYFTTARGHGGTGLGLFIAKGLVEAHGGKIWVDTRAGEGTTFYFTLPDRKQDAVAQS